MVMNNMLLGIICAIGISCGQVLFKLAAVTLSPITDMRSLLSIISNIYFVASVFIYAMSTLLWIWLLKRVSLRNAYPLMALAFIIVPLMACLFLHEELELRTVIGGIIIIFGVCYSVK